MEVINFFRSWCTKNNKVQKFDVRPYGRRNRKRFSCELRVDGYSYIGTGTSPLKIQSRIEAVKDFLQYLVYEGAIKASDIPFDELASAPRPLMEVDPFFGSSTDLLSRGPFGGYNNAFSYEETRYKVGPKKRKEVEDPDVDADKHGNWTTEFAKSKLHSFLRENKIRLRYQYSHPTPDEVVAELSFHVHQLNRSLVGSGTGSNKLLASKRCALSLVRQLFDNGVIEAFTGTLKKDREKLAEVKPFAVAISPELEAQVHEALDMIKVEPVRIPEEVAPETGLSILSSTVLDEFAPSKPEAGVVIQWQPPLTNWNAWTSCNLDEGPLASATLSSISQDLGTRQKAKLESDESLQKMVKEREAHPIAAKKKEITQMISKNRVIMIRGNTGCGKTTQVCQYILDEYIQSGRGAYCNILVAQPRRIPALFVAERVADERSETLGLSVGYSVLYESCLPRPYGAILFSTVDVLLKKLETGLRGISHIIVDDIHEREINTDVFLVILREMVRKYPGLRVILMSSAVDTTLFSSYFDNCPVLEITETLFPVEEYFLEDCVELLKFTPPPKPKKRKRGKDTTEKDEKDEDDNKDGEEKDEDGDEHQEAEEVEENLNLMVSDKYSARTKESMAALDEQTFCFELLEELLKYIKNLNVLGDILVFLPGWNIICTLLLRLKDHPIFGRTNYRILPLHSQLTHEDQQKVFDPVPAGITRIILSTSIAENSFTITNVVYVINYCKIKVEVFKGEDKVTQYTTVWASRTNLEQRKVRAGRTKAGHCFHLCSRARFEKLEDRITPEIFRRHLHEQALTIKLLRLGSISQFFSNAIEPPPVEAVAAAESLLRDMKCLDSNGELTPLGKILGKLPIQPRLGKMMILACLFSCADALATMATSSSDLPEVFIKPFERRQLTFQQKCFSGSRYSDHFAVLNAFQTWENIRMDGVKSEKEFCNSKMISMPTLRIIWEAKNQLMQLLSLVGFPEDTMEPQVYSYTDLDTNLDIVMALICVGLYPNVAYHLEKRKIVTAGKNFALVYKTSVNCSNRDTTLPFPFFVYDEKVKAQVVSCKQLTMVTPIQLLLFGCKKVEYVDKVIRLDDWINLDVKPEVAAAIVALRPALESLMIQASREPEKLLEIVQENEKVISVVKKLCELNAGKYGMEQVKIVEHHPPAFSHKGSYHGKKRKRMGNYGGSYHGGYRGGSFHGGYGGGNSWE